MTEEKIDDACLRFLKICEKCKKDDNILIVTDEKSLDMGMALWDTAKEFSNRTLVLTNTGDIKSEERSGLVSVVTSEADVTFWATRTGNV